MNQYDTIEERGKNSMTSIVSLNTGARGDRDAALARRTAACCLARQAVETSSAKLDLFTQLGRERLLRRKCNGI